MVSLFTLSSDTASYIYKIICKALNTLVKYKDVHIKANVKDVSFETDLHR